MIRRTMMAAAAMTLGACGGSKAPAPDTSAGAVPAPAAVPAVDSAKADSTTPATDTSAKAPTPAAKPAAAKAGDAKAPLGDHDVAVKPKFTIDEKTGKVTPIKRP